MKYKIYFKSINSVTRFVKIISKYSFTGVVCSGRYVVSASSLLGLFSLNLSVPVTLQIDSDASTDELDTFLSDIKDYLIDEM